MAKGSEDTKAVPDKSERTQALDPSRSFIVQAPAGSGKTALLIQRFLRTLSYVNCPEEVLAITFTKKAASEMHGRIYSALVRAEAGAIGEDENSEAELGYARAALERSREFGWALVENPARLQVLTIDSFSATLARRMPLMSKLGANLGVSESPDKLYKAAARQTLKMIDNTGADSAAVAQVLKYHDNSIEEVESKIVEMLVSREQWLRHIGSVADNKELRTLLEASVARMVGAELAPLAALFPSHLIPALLTSARYAASNIDPAVNTSPISGLQELDSLPGVDSACLALWCGVAELFITKGGAWRKPKGVSKSIGFPADKKDGEKVKQKENFKELLAKLSVNGQLLKALHEVRALPGSTYSASDWATLEALLHLLPCAVAHLLEIFREERTVDFSEISMAAIEALGPEQNPTDLMLALDNRYSHILVDEYQDTSWTQVTLLRALTRGFEPNDGRSLFIVGDPMQSIYLFRDAEVGLFLDARLSGIGPLKLAPLTLRTNFRSDGHIVDWVNSTFHRALPEIESVMTGAVTYEKSEAFRATTIGAAVQVKLYEERADSKEADDIIELLGSIDQGETCAVLVRSRGHLNTLVARLKAEGIDFRAEKFDPLKERPVVQDLFALTRALYHPADRIAWLAVLRSRVCGFTLSDLHQLTLGDLKSPVLSLMHDKARLSRLSATARVALARLSSCIDSALSLIRRVPPKALVEGLWCALGGPACYEDDDSMADAELYFKMIESVSLRGDITCSAIEELDSLVDGLFATHNGRGENPVFLTTIHNAKGLEFDHVILPGLGRVPRAGKKRLLHWMERGDDLILASIESKASTASSGGEGGSKLYGYLNRVDKQKHRYETARLFYVAVTRAKKRLYLFGHATKIDRDEVSVESASLLGCIAHALLPEMVVKAKEEQLDSGSSPDLEPDLEDDNAGVVGGTLYRLPTDWRAPEPIAAAGVVSELSEVGTEAAAQGERLKYDWATITASYVGTVVHGFFCRVATEGLGNWTPLRVEAERALTESELLSFGINRGSVATVADKCLALVAAALNDDAGRWVLGEQNEARVEWALSGVIDGEVADVVIDRTFVDEKNVRWIVDYKTGRHEGGSVEGFLEDEKERHAPQLNRYARMLRGYGEERTIKLALYYPALKRLVEL